MVSAVEPPDVASQKKESHVRPSSRPSYSLSIL